MVKKFRFSNFVFTLNNYTQEQVIKLRTVDYQFITFGYEVSDSKTTHLQVYCELKTRRTMLSIKKFLTISEIHIDKRNGNQKQACRYTYKGETPWDIFKNSREEYGINYKGESYGELKKQGERTSLKEFYEGIKQGLSKEEMYEEHTGPMIKYQRAYIDVSKMFKQNAVKKILDIKNSELTLMDWQQYIEQRLLIQSDRQILWIKDDKGNRGKTILANYIEWKYDAFVTTNGKVRDIAYAYNYQSIVIFDLPRTNEEYVNYQVIENFKDGRLFSSKYESVVKRFLPCKVLVLANFEPSDFKLSKDRFDVIDLDKLLG